MPEVPAILAFDSVTSMNDGGYNTHIENLTFALGPGELGLVRFDRHTPRCAIPDAAMGLAELNSGEVTFLTQPWSTLKPRETAQQRGQIGRFFGENGWVRHLDVDENITLRERHHTYRGLADIESEAEQLAAAFGLTNGIPRVRPNNVDARDLQRSACVRMLLGSPPLIVMDEPASGLFADVLDSLIEQLPIARARGAAVLWLSAERFVWTNESIKPTLKIDLSERKIA